MCGQQWNRLTRISDSTDWLSCKNSTKRKFFTVKISFFIFFPEYIRNSWNSVSGTLNLPLLFQHNLNAAGMRRKFSNDNRLTDFL